MPSRVDGTTQDEFSITLICKTIQAWGWRGPWSYRDTASPLTKR